MSEKASSVFQWRSAITSSDLPSTTRLVLFAISLYMNGKGEKAFPSQARLASDCGLSDRSVRDQIKRAEADGFIGKSKTKSKNTKHVFTQYEPFIPAGIVVEPPEGGSGLTGKGFRLDEDSDRKEIPVVPEGGSAATGTSFLCYRNEVPTNTPYNSPINSSVNTPIGASPEEPVELALVSDESPVDEKPKKREVKFDAKGGPIYDEDFASIWPLFVNGGSKKKAFESFVKINPDTELLRAMHVALTKYAMLHAESESAPNASLTYQKNAQGWFTARDWETEFKVRYQGSKPMTAQQRDQFAQAAAKTSDDKSYLRRGPANSMEPLDGEFEKFFGDTKAIGAEA